MKRIFICFLLLTCFLVSQAQLVIWDTAAPSFEWRLRLVDIPFSTDAAKANQLRKRNLSAPFHGNLPLKSYGAFYKNLSMEQGTDMARNIHGSLYLGHNIVWNRWKPVKNGTSYILNRLFANITALGTDYLAIKLPYGYAFQHEEFHRAVLSSRHIYSYDEVWNFGKGLDIAVTGVKDTDLEYLKKHFPADQVRLAAAGVEGEYAFFKRMREDNFFEDRGYPFVGLSILGTLHGINYVRLPLRGDFDRITDSILSHDKQNILARDFTGYDFSAWVYDLFRPDEPYRDRGQWPGGVGIQRPVKAAQLTPEMKDFLKETGKMQYLNLISPFMVGINRMKWGQGSFNFSLRSVPSSFGYYAGADVFLKKEQTKLLVSLGINRSRHLILPALEMKAYDMWGKNGSSFGADIQMAAWMQPKDQLFFAKNSRPGIGLGFHPFYRVSKKLRLIADFTYKTRGWMFGNPYLDDRFISRLGFAINTLP